MIERTAAAIKLNMLELVDTANGLVADDKDLLAMDESNLTGNKRFARLGIPQTEEARRAGQVFEPAGAIETTGA